MFSIAARLILAICAIAHASAATYYIDYTSGDDANKGDSKSAPWKRAPGMSGWAGIYSHAPGDRFIFKGGVRWPTTCFQWKITEDGSESAPGYYGADTTWFEGPSFKRPLFDFERRIINGWTVGAGVLLEGVDWAVIDNLEFANHAAPLGKNGISNWGCMTITLDSCHHITLSNCLVRDWWMPNVNGVIEPGTSGGGGIQKVNQGDKLTAIGCEFHQLGAGVISGSALWNIVTVQDCHIHHCASAVMSANFTRGNHIHDLKKPSDPAAHSNAMLNYGANIVSGNEIHDLDPTAQVIFIVPGAFGPGDTHIFNNVVYRVTQPPIALDTDRLNHQGQRTYVWNNTLVGAYGKGPCIRVGERKNGPFAFLEVLNNHFITSGKPILMNAPASGGGRVTKFSESHNLTQTPAQAGARGYTDSNKYAPSADTSPTVRAGMDLSARFTNDFRGVLRVAPWDIGAYQFKKP